MEVDIEQLILKAAALKMEDRTSSHESYFIWKAFEGMYPQVALTVRVREQVKEYKKLTMWRE